MRAPAPAATAPPTPTADWAVTEAADVSRVEVVVIVGSDRFR